jgi:hypothetical protein
MPPFNPFANLDKLVFTNISASALFGLPYPDQVPLPDGTLVPTAAVGQPDSVTYWLAGPQGAYVEITENMAFAQYLYLHHVFGAPVGEFTQSPVREGLGINRSFEVTREGLESAIESLPHIASLIDGAGISSDAVWGYAQAVAPWAVDLVGIPSA